ncbi:putative nucleotidyltransferase substrate binding domain-containing protein [Gordonia araii]|nr:putative nucleotidyltransferase substrate binding domain-containing protein [Gordonia araii]NNG95897.1 hypothetical protein [Gordonia araii NBRC 100433]
MKRPAPGDAVAAISQADDRIGLSESIRSARDVLAMAARQADAAQAAEWWSALVVEAVAAAVRVIGAPAGVEWEWFVTGSCARGEGLPGADVETLIRFGPDADRRRDVLAAAADVHDVLERAGIAPDGNGAIGSRARCCRTDEGWREATDSWAADPATDRGVVMAGLTLDALPVTGTGESSWLAQTMLAACRRHPALAAAMAQDCSAVREVVPARLAVLTRRADTVDIKQAVVDPIVRLARLKSVLGDSGERSTQGRLTAPDGVLTDIDWPALTHALTAATGLRWALRRDRWMGGRSVGDVVALSELAPHERALLRGAGREVMGAQRVLAYVAATEIR